MVDLGISFIRKEMSLPESVQLLNGQNENTMNTEVPGEALPLDSMATSLANQLSGSQEKPKSEEIRLDVSSESSARQMKNQALFSSKDKNHVIPDTVIPSLSATQLMQSIIKASQSSHDILQSQQQTTDMKNHVPLPADLQSFKGDLFSLSSPTHTAGVGIFQTSNYQHSNDLDLTKDSSQMMGQHSQNPMFSAVSSPEFAVTGSSFGTVSPQQIDLHNVTPQQTNLLQSFPNPVVSAQQMPTNFSEALHLNMPENNLSFDSVTKNPSLPSFENIANVNSQPNSDFGTDKSSVLERLLTSERQMENNLNTITSPGSKSVSSPDYPTGSPTSLSSSNSPYTDSNTPVVAITDTNTQSSLIIKSEKLRLDSTCSNSFALESDEMNPVRLETFSWDVTHIEDDEIEHIEQSKKIRKAQKCSEDTDAPSSVVAPSVEQVFNAGEASATSADFTFSKFGKKDEVGLFTFGSPVNAEHSTIGSLPVLGSEQFKTPHPVTHTGTRRHGPPRKSKEPILNQQFPSKLGGYELKIINQPEEQHRARYLTEGSRGAVKNRTGEGYPCVKLFGHNDDATLQVFIGNDTGRVRPHGFYQACKVCGKNATMCTEKEIDGTNVIEIDLRPVNDMTVPVDCVGILKLRNADVEQRIGIAKAKKKSTKARMIFRANFQKSDGTTQTLQVSSHPILCTQPIGQPEICKMSLKEGTAAGGDELFIIGKNFLRGTKVFFQELAEEENGGIKWEKESEIDRDYFQPTHIVCTVPEYTGLQRLSGVRVLCQVVINSGGKLSEGQQFVYTPAEPPQIVKQEVPMETEDSSKRNSHAFVAPEAIELNQQIQQVQQESDTDMFQLPPGVISDVATEERTLVPMEQGGQSQPQPEYTEIRDQQSDRLEKKQQQSYQNTPHSEKFLSENIINPEGNDLLQNPVPVTTNCSQHMTQSDNFSFQQTNLGVPKTESTFSAESDSIVSQFLENMSAAFTSQNQEPASSDHGTFSTSLPTKSAQSHQVTMSTQVTNKSSSSDSQSFSNRPPSATGMEFSLQSSPVRVGVAESQLNENGPLSADSSLKEIFGTNILSQLDNLQYSLMRGSPFSPEQVVPNNLQVHVPADTMTSTRENLTVEARISCDPVVSESVIQQVNVAGGAIGTPLKDQSINQNCQGGSHSFGLQTSQHYPQADPPFNSGSAATANAIPNLEGPFQQTQGISGSVQQQNILGSVQPEGIGNVDVAAQGRMSVESYPLSQATSNQPSENALDTCTNIQSPENIHTPSPEGQGSFRRNSSLGSMEGAQTGLGNQMSLSQNPLSSPVQSISSQILANEMPGSVQQGNSVFTQSQIAQGTNTAVSLSGSISSQPGFGNRQNTNPQIIICNNPPAQGIAPQFGPSIVIVPGGGAEGQHNQVENLLRSILGSLTQPHRQQQGQQQQTFQQPMQGQQLQQHTPLQQHAQLQQQQQLQDQQSHLQQQLQDQQHQQQFQQQRQLQDQQQLQQHIQLQQQQHNPQQLQQNTQLQQQLQDQQQLQQNTQLQQQLQDQQQIQQNTQLQQQLQDQQQLQQNTQLQQQLQDQQQLQRHTQLQQQQQIQDQQQLQQLQNQQQLQQHTQLQQQLQGQQLQHQQHNPPDHQLLQQAQVHHHPLVDEQTQI